MKKIVYCRNIFLINTIFFIFKKAAYPEQRFRRTTPSLY